MLVEGTFPITVASMEVDTNDPAEAVRQFIAKYPKARIESINGDLLRGICACGTPVFEDTIGYRYDNDARMYVCPVCISKETLKQGI